MPAGEGDMPDGGARVAESRGWTGRSLGCLPLGVTPAGCASVYYGALPAIGEGEPSILGRQPPALEGHQIRRNRKVGVTTIDQLIDERSGVACSAEGSEELGE